MESLRLATETLKGSDWTIDSKNCNAALILLGDRKPSNLTVHSTITNPLTATALSALAEMLGICKVNLVFVDSFVAPHNTDVERLKYFLANSRVRITEFCGHLDAAGIARLPDDIERLALAIHSPADAAAVADLSSRLENNFCILYVAVSSAVSPGDLRPLHNGVHAQALHFPGLSDAGVGMVTPAIEALMGRRPHHECYYLKFPNCRLTTQGFLQLAQQLAGLKWQLCSVCIECSGDKPPDLEEREDIEIALGRIGGWGHDLSWEVFDWPYESRALWDF